MPKWSVGAGVEASTYVGEYEADTAEEAMALAAKDAGVSLCHECSREVSDPEINHFWAENQETGEVVEERPARHDAAERELRDLKAKLREKLLGWDNEYADSGEDYDMGCVEGLRRCARDLEKLLEGET